MAGLSSTLFHASTISISGNTATATTSPAGLALSDTIHGSDGGIRYWEGVTESIGSGLQRTVFGFHFGGGVEGWFGLSATEAAFWKRNAVTLQVWQYGNLQKI